MEAKKIAKEIRNYLKEHHQNLICKVRTDNKSYTPSIDVHILKTDDLIAHDIDQLNDDDKHRLSISILTKNNGSMYQDELKKQAKEELVKNRNYYHALFKKQLEEIEKFVNRYVIDNSDAMIDYFDINIYIFVNIVEDFC